MSRTPPHAEEPKLLPGEPAPRQPVSPSTPPLTEIIPAFVPMRQLSELPKDELEQLAEEFGLSIGDYKSSQHLVAAIHDRRQMIGGLDRETLLEVIRWGRRPVLANLNKEQLAQEIVRIKSMRFEGLSQQGLVVLTKLRGVKVNATDDVPTLVNKLKRKEGFFTRVNRKRRAMLGSLVSNMLGENDPAKTGNDYQFVPPADAGGASSTTATPSPKSAMPSIKEEIEDAGLFSGIAGRIKRSADDYLNQKLDEIESRIDRKLDEIDRRLAEWRDKEIANRIRILKITLWASVIVGAFSLIYAYVHELVYPSPAPPVPQKQADIRSK